jgi:hypothetical protein
MPMCDRSYLSVIIVVTIQSAENFPLYNYFAKIFFRFFFLKKKIP